MNTNDHTPGPWTYEHTRHEGKIKGCWFDIPDSTLATTTFTLGRSFEKVAHANGRLMAAAPDLLDAAYEMLALIHDMTEGEGRVSFMNNCDQVRGLMDAIAKAEGR